MLKLTIAAALIVCGTSAASVFPLETGNTWTYRDRQSGASFTIRVGTQVFANDRLYYSLRGYTDSPLLVRSDERGELVYLDEENRRELTLTSFAPFEGGWWNAPGRPCEQEGQTLEKRSQYTGPAGSYAGVLEIRYRNFGCADTGVSSERFAENIGMVERTVTTFAGPRVFDLVSARVGNLTVDGEIFGRFTVSVTDPPAGPLTVTLRLSARPPAPIRLTFPSAQEYDVVVRDAEGRVIWRWSDGRAFAQVLHVREVNGEWSVAVEVPRPEAGVYTIDGFLTTEGGPRFAAVAPPSVLPAQNQ